MVEITVGFGEGSTGGNVGLEAYGQLVNLIVGSSDGNIEVGNKVDKDEGSLGLLEGDMEGKIVGEKEGLAEAVTDGTVVGLSDGKREGIIVGDTDGVANGREVG